MAKRAARKGARRSKRTRSTRPRTSRSSAGKRAAARRKAAARSRRRRPAPKKRAARKAARPKVRRIARRPTVARLARPVKTPRLDRARRTLDDFVPTPPSSLDMDRKGSSVRTGRAELGEQLAEHGAMSPAITGGDVDADWENAYFSGDEAPGGDNPTPDQEVVDDIGKALGLEYQDNEELKSGEKVSDRDRHRWELDPASSEDYKERK